MKVTEYSKSLAVSNFHVQWPSTCADYIFDFEVARLPIGEPLTVGTYLHDYLPKHLDGVFVPDAYADVCSVVFDTLNQVGIDQVECEAPVHLGELDGRLDMHGIDVRGRHWVIEIKTTQGRHLEPPSGREIFQMALYANLLKVPELPGLICMRINLRTQKIGIYRAYDAWQWVKVVREAAA